METPFAVLKKYPEHDYSLAGALHSRVSARGSHPLLVEGSRTTSWASFEAQVVTLATSLHERGVRKGERVAVMARSSRTHLLLLFAVARLGAILVPVNPEFTAPEAGYAFGHCEVCGIIADTAAMSVARSASESLAHAPWIMEAGAVEDGPAEFDLLIETPITAPLPPQGSCNDPCLIIFTSGSTGYPKAVLHSQRSVLLAGEAYVERVHLQPADRVLVVLPLFHLNGLVYQLGGTIAAGATAIVVPKFSASRFWSTAVDERCTVVNLLVTLANILKARPRSEFRPDHSIRVICGGMQAVNEDCFRDEFRIPHRLAGYGMSEIPGVTCVPYDGPHKVGSMGVLSRHPDPDRPWAACRIVDDAGHDVARGQTGEMVVKTPIIMLGYFRDPERTQTAFRDGWFLTGDLVRQDEDGYFFFVGRKKDMFRRRGENISALEVERAIESHPSVIEAAAIAVPSELGEDDILAAIVTRPDVTLNAREIAQWCRQKLAAVKVPRYIVFIPELPHVGPQKVAKEVLRKDASLRERAVDIDAMQDDSSASVTA